MQTTHLERLVLLSKPREVYSSNKSTAVKITSAFLQKLQSSKTESFPSQSPVSPLNCAMEQSTGNDWGRESWNYHRSTVKQDTVNIFNLQVGLRTNTKSVLLGDSWGKSEVHHTLPSARITCNTSCQQMIKRFPKAISRLIVGLNPLSFFDSTGMSGKERTGNTAFSLALKWRETITRCAARHCKSYNKSRLQSHFL